MKIAIITWVFETNYGTVLQAYSLQKYLLNKGHTVDLINTQLEKEFTISKLDRILNIRKNFWIRLLNKYFYKNNMDNELRERQVKLDKFINNYISLTNKINTENDLIELNNNYDCFISGSDQIWNPNSFDKKYFLPFVKKGKKKISYAPSLGVSELPKEFCDKYKDLLLTYSNVSVRELDGKKILDKLSIPNVNVVCDPTLLLTSRDYENFLLDVDNSNYIFCYFLGNNKKYIDGVLRMGKKLNKKVLLLPNSNKDYSYKNIEILNHLGVDEFLSHIKNADLVCTDSFHGLVFCSIFNKKCIPFARFKNDDKKSQNSRVYNFLENQENGKVQIVSFQTSINEYMNFITSLKYSNERIKFSKEYLDNAIL